VKRAAAADQDFVEVRLQKGINELLLAVTNDQGNCGYYFRLDATSFDDQTKALLGRGLGDLEAAEREALAAVFLAKAPEMAATREQIARARTAIDDLKGPLLPVMREMPAYKRRTTHIHLRGSFLSKGDEVSATVPAVFPPMPEDAPRNRLGLARWLVSRDNPLTARVQVNRFWEQLFGRGLVATTEDFGTQGDRPSHPLLLDWLAAEFMEDGWSVKRLLKRIVLSSTYRQSVVPADGVRERDPHNLLLTRGPSFRLPAEVLRDRALAVSGLLQHQVGGPSVMPDQPQGVWAQIYSGAKWQVSPGADRYRRSLYTFWRRTSPHPAMTTFDAPSREFCVVSRVRTNTPLQALVTWNEPQFVEAARALAARVLREGGDDDERLDRMFWLALLREPDAGERERMLAFVRGELRQFAADPEAARSLVPATESDAVRHAAWTMCASVLMNLDEFLTKG
ncbi:MAG: DUF1553 domain-containing protein, partial [Planctomycetota bacterium]|nr:DUF1553 domain-containing protein [Planctomycetota bacterium]